jgi:hypothetical protein
MVFEVKVSVPKAASVPVMESALATLGTAIAAASARRASGLSIGKGSSKKKCGIERPLSMYARM